MKKFLFFPFLAFSVLGATPTLTNFNARHFIVDATQVPTNTIRLNLNPSQFDTNADSITITITNIAGLVGSSLWTNSAGVLQPLGHTGGTNQFTIAEATGWTGAGTNAFFDDGTFSGVAVINPTDTYIPYRANAYTLEDSPWYVVSTNAAIDSQIIFGPGTTNVLYRSGSSLIYTNYDPVGTSFKIGNDATHFLSLVTAGASSTIIGPVSGALFFQANPSANDYAVLTSMGFVDNNERLSLGQPGNSWTNQYFKGSLFQYGFYANAGADYSRLAISHGGTNGAVVLDSQASGTAGSPRPFHFNWNGTNIVYLDSSTSLGSSQVLFHIINSDGTTTLVGTSTGGHANLIAGTGKVVYLGANNNGSGDFVLGSTYAAPVTPSALSLGTSTSPWGDFYAKIVEHTPASSAETNYVGMVTRDDSYLYVWTATNVNKRATLSTW